MGVVVALAAFCRVAIAGQGAIPDVVLALAAGIALRVALGIRIESMRAGVDFVLHYLLRAAIVLLGAGLSLQAVREVGGSTLLLVISCCAVALALGFVLARVARMSRNLGMLIGAGTAICGGSAILAIGPILEASSDEMAYAITTIFTFNVVALFLYPAIGHALAMSSSAFGSWVGTAVNDTSVVIATAYAFSPDAGTVATIVKLSRTVLLVPLSLAIGYYVYRGGNGRVASVRVPWFIFGFVGLAALNSLHVLTPQIDRAATGVASFLIVCVLAAVGLSVDPVRIFRQGARPMVVGLALASFMGAFSFAMLGVLHLR